MKWIAFFGALFVLVPLLASWAQKKPALHRGLFTFLAFDLFSPQHINLISEETYRGDSRGIELTSTDLLAITLWLVSRKLGRSRREPRPLVIPRVLYLLAVLASFAATPSALRSTYSVWKLLRMYFYFEVLVEAFADIELATAALDGLALGVMWQGLTSLYQKYALHAVRTVGTQSHPNSMAMICNLIAPIAFALILAGKGKRTTLWVYIAAAACDVFSLSRGGMMMFLLATALVYVGSVIRQPTSRKLKTLLVLGIAGTLAIAKSADTIIKRFTEAPKESELARKLFNKAAEMMADDHTFGVGINMYSFVLDTKGYADRVHADAGDRNGIAHHIYWLTAAEIGYVGLLTYLILLAAVLYQAVRASRRRDLRGDVALGISAGLVVTYLQGTAEWIARQTTMSYAFWMYAALAVAFVRAPQGPRAT